MTTKCWAWWATKSATSRWVTARRPCRPPTVSAARDAADAAGGATVAALNKSQLGNLTEKFINAQFSQSQKALPTTTRST